VRQDVLLQVAARHGHILAVARLDVLEEAFGEVGHGGIFCAGHFLLLLFLCWRLAQRHQMCRLIPLQAGVLQGKGGVLAECELFPFAIQPIAVTPDDAATRQHFYVQPAIVTDDVRGILRLERLECGVCERHGPSFGSMKVNSQAIR